MNKANMIIIQSQLRTALKKLRDIDDSHIMFTPLPVDISEGGLLVYHKLYSSSDMRIVAALLLDAHPYICPDVRTPHIFTIHIQPDGMQTRDTMYTITTTKRLRSQNV